MEFVELIQEEYDEFARKHKYRNFLNSADAFVLRQQYGYETAFVAIKDNGKIRCAAGIVFLASMKSKYAYAQRGFLIDYQDKQLVTMFTEKVISYLKEKQILYLKIDPYVPYREHDINGDVVLDGFDNSYVVKHLQALGYIHQGFTTGFHPDHQVRWMVVLSLDTMDEESLMKQMDQQTRWSINKARKLGVCVRELAIEELDTFMQIMQYASSTRNFSDMSKDHYLKQRQVYGDNAKMMMAYIDTEAMIQTIDVQFNEEEVLLQEIEERLKELPNSKKFLKKKKVQLEALATCRTRKEEVLAQEAQYGKQIPIAVSYFVLYEDEIVYVSSGAYDAFRKYNGPYAIQWEMLKYAMKHNFTRYNFYGTSGDFSKEAIDYGVFEFKKGFHGVVEELVGDFVLPIQKGKYHILKGLHGLKEKLR